jgi:hypothetical protein
MTRASRRFLRTARHPALYPKAAAANYGMPVSRTIEDMAMELAFLMGELSPDAPEP